MSAFSEPAHGTQLFEDGEWGARRPSALARGRRASLCLPWRPEQCPVQYSHFAANPAQFPKNPARKKPGTELLSEEDM